jgi:hypothetical protein
MAPAQQYPGYQQGPDGQWYPVQNLQAAPPGWQAAPAAPHLPPEAQLPPQGMPAPQGFAPAQPPMLQAPVGNNPAPAPEAAPKRGRGRPKGNAEQVAQATAAAEQTGPDDARAVFLRAICLCVASSIDVSDANAMNEQTRPVYLRQQAMNTVQYAELVYDYLSATKAI